MGITADDITHKQFLKRFFRSGYDMDEVDAFLDEVAERVHELGEENSSLTKEINDLKESNARHEAQEATFKNALISAQKVADDLVAQSRQEADGLLNEAREKVARAQREAEEQINKLQEEVDSLRQLRDSMRQEINKALESFQEVVDNISTASPRYHFLDKPAQQEEPDFDTQNEFVPPGIEEEEESILYEKIDLDEEPDSFEDLTVDSEGEDEDQCPAIFNGMTVEDEEEEDKGPELD